MHSFIRAAREREKHSACCVRNDRSGCVQTSEEECSVCARLPRVPSLACVCVVVMWLRMEPVALSFTLDLGTLHHLPVRGPSDHTHYLLIPDAYISPQRQPL